MASDFKVGDEVIVSIPPEGRGIYEYRHGEKWNETYIIRGVSNNGVTANLPGIGTVYTYILQHAFNQSDLQPDMDWS